MDNTTKQLYKEFTKEFKADIIETVAVLIYLVPIDLFNTRVNG